MNKHYTVAIVGNPNAGKTSIFNALVGARQHVGNWPGVTVEKKEGKFSFKGHSILCVDLPGTYSLTAYSQEEIITRRFILDEKPDMILNVIDTTNLERNLYLTTQLMEMNVPIVIALNMFDEAEQKHIVVDIDTLSALLGIPLIETSAVKLSGIDRLKEALGAHLLEETATRNDYKLEYHQDLEEIISQLMTIIAEDATLSSQYPPRWLAIKLIEQGHPDGAVVQE